MLFVIDDQNHIEKHPNKPCIYFHRDLAAY